MCMRIVSEDQDFAISHRCMLLEQSVVSCHQEELVHRRLSAIWQKSWSYNTTKNIYFSKVCFPQKLWYIKHVALWFVKTKKIKEEHEPKRSNVAVRKVENMDNIW